MKYPELDVEFPSSKITTKKEIERLLLFSMLELSRIGEKLTPQHLGRFFLTDFSYTSLYGSFQK